MKVCLISAEYPPLQGGVGDYTSWLAAALTDLGLQVWVVTSASVADALSKDRPKDIPWADNIRAVVPRWDYGCWNHVLQVIKGITPDVVHLQYQTASFGMHPAINLLPLRIRSMSQRPRLVATFHDLKVPYLFPKAGAIRRVPGALLARFADAVVVTNEEDLEQVVVSKSRKEDGLHSRYGQRPLYWIPIGSNIPVRPPDGYDRLGWRHRLGVDEDDVLLGYFGFLNESKGVDMLFAALKGLLGRGRKVKLLMIGGHYGDSDPTNVAYGTRLKADADRSPYHSHVLWTGFTDRAQVSANLLAVDICVLPFNEGASLRHGSLMAAIAHGLPIVTTRADPPSNASTTRYGHGPSIPSLEGRTMLVPPRDLGALVEAIEQLAVSALAREKLRQRILEIAPLFEWEPIARETVKVYEDVLLR